MRYKSEDGSMEMHFWLTRGGWTLICMGRDPLYKPTGGFTLRDRISELMHEEGSDFKVPIFEIDSLGYDLISVFATEYCGDKAADLITAWVREFDDRNKVGILPILEAISWQPYLNGTHKTRFYRPAFARKTSTASTF